jgi:hypothetical protein
MTNTVSGQTLQKWEYCYFTKPSERHLLTELFLAGQEGWELVSASYNKDMKGAWAWTGFMKRPAGVGVPSAAAAHAPAGGGQTVIQPPKPSAGGDSFDLSDGDFGFKE